MRQIEMFTEEEKCNKLSKLGDSLERLKAVDWEMFRPILEGALKKEHKGSGGRPAYDFVLLFKILVLQRLYNLSDDQTEFLINDRLSFMRFLGLNLSSRVPDAKTIWLFRNNLVNANIIKDIFKLYGEHLKRLNIITRKGSIVDAAFVDAPRQRNTREENETIKCGNIPEKWKEETHKSKHRLSQKDVDARWAVKGGEKHYGYKDHVKVDAESKIITDFSVTNAAVHDSKEIVRLADETDKAIYADKAYCSQAINKALPKNVENHICRKGCRLKELSIAERTENRKNARVRARIEHVFGFMTKSMHGLTLRCIGLSRAAFNIGLTNLVYNMCRLSTLQRELSM